MNPVEEYILRQREPFQSMMLYVREVIKHAVPEVEEKFSYRIPFYHYKGKPMLYLNVLKGTNYLDIAFMRGTILQNEFPEMKDYNNRKTVRSLQMTSLENMDGERLVAVVQAAAELINQGKTAW